MNNLQKPVPVVVQAGEIFSIEPVNEDAQLFDIARMAQAKHLHLVTNGKRSALCSIIPHGWWKIPAGFKPAPEAA